MLGTVFRNLFLLAGVSGVAATSQLTQARIAAVRVQVPGVIPQVQPQVPLVPQTLPPSPAQFDPMAGVVAEWKRLQLADSYPFTDYANFLLAHPGFPGQTARRAAAETSLLSGALAPELTIRFFERFPPLTSAGHIRFAEGLAAAGRMTEAREHARSAWRHGVLRPGDEALVVSAFGGSFTAEDQDARMDMLLWQNATASAQRQLALTSADRRPIFLARLALRANAPGAFDQASAVQALGDKDPGFIADRANWLKNNAQWPVARAYLARPRSLAYLPGSPEEWYEVLLTNARGAAADGQYALAYDIARQVDDAYAAGTDVSGRPYGERDDYTSLVWLAGTTALLNLGRPQDAVPLFERYTRGSRTPQTQSKGLYWAGRAAEAAGDQAGASGYYARAAGYSDLYYGQLAAERLHQPLKAPPALATPTVAPAVRDAFYAREVVRATKLLGTLGDWRNQSLFIRQIAQDATTDSDHVLAAELSRVIGRPDLGVMVGRSALENGLNDYTAAGYPSIAVPADQESNWTMIHAIARQESQFDMQAVSRTGARGLMQLMPGTAREMAVKVGVAWNPASLADPQYNIQLGSSYFQRLLNYNGGSYPLAVAAYNAGQGNVNKWLAAYGDPRLPGGDIVQWIEKIPFFETRNYVQRVLENAVVYDLMNPAHAHSRGEARLSWYLGKQRPG